MNEKQDNNNDDTIKGVYQAVTDGEPYKLFNGQHNDQKIF